jgi:anti-sigma factor RsiW
VPVMVEIPELTVLEEEFEDEKKREREHWEAEKKRFEKLDRAIHRIESKIGSLDKRVPPKEEVTKREKWNDLLQRVVRVFSFTFIATFIPLVSGLGALPDFATAKAAGWAAILAGMAAVLKLVQASVTRDEEPFLDKGLFGTKTT